MILRNYARNILSIIRLKLGIEDCKQGVEDCKIALNNILSTLCEAPDPWLVANQGSKSGKRCFLLGAGPSLKLVDLALLKNEDVMALNGAIFAEGVTPSYFVTVSNFFYKGHIEALEELSCRRFLPSFLKGKLGGASPISWLPSLSTHQLKGLTNSVPWNYSNNPAQLVALGGTGIFAGLQILDYLGYDEVILLGIDHDFGDSAKEAEKNGGWIKGADSPAHFMKNYFQPDENVHFDVKAIETSYSLASKIFHSKKKVIRNASPGTLLTTYPIVDFESLF